MNDSDAVLRELADVKRALAIQTNYLIQIQATLAAMTNTQYLDIAHRSAHLDELKRRNAEAYEAAYSARVQGFGESFLRLSENPESEPAETDQAHSQPDA